jgi:hypothetical protein
MNVKLKIDWDIWLPVIVLSVFLSLFIIGTRYLYKTGNIIQVVEVFCSNDMSENLSIREKINILSDDYVISDTDFQDFVRGKISFIVEKRQSTFTDKIWYTVRPHRVNYNLKQLFNGTTENKTDVHPSNCGN